MEAFQMAMTLCVVDELEQIFVDLTNYGYCVDVSDDGRMLYFPDPDGKEITCTEEKCFYSQENGSSITHEEMEEIICNW